MATIIPAILATTEEEVAQLLLRASEFASEVQVDIVDGAFATPASFPYSKKGFTPEKGIGTLPHSEELRIELDLMIDDPETSLSAWMNTGATRFLFHLESTTNFKKILETLKHEYGYDKGFMTEALSVGLSISQGTNLELLEPYIDDINYVQFMGIKHIGVQGQPFSGDCITQVRRFRQKHPDTPIQVDGGVSSAVAAELLQLGVSRLVIGSALWKTADPRATFEELSALAEKYGIYE